MKKKIILAIIVLVVLVLGGFTWLFMNTNKLIEKNKAALEKIASDALDAHVSFGALQTTVFPEAKITVNDVKIARAKEAKKSLELKNLTLHVKLTSLLSGKIDIQKLSLDSPVLPFVKNEDGIFVDAFVKKQAKKKKKRKKDQAASSAPAPTKKSLSAAVDLNLNSFEVNKARLNLTDKLFQKEYALENVNIKAKVDFASGTFSVPQITIEGSAPKNTPFSLTGTELKYNLGASKLDINQISLKTSFNTHPVSLSLKGSVVGKDLLINNLHIDAFAGAADIDAELKEAKHFLSNLKAGAINIEQVMQAVNSDSKVKLAGIVEELSGKLEGKLGKKLRQSLSGQYRLKLKDGELKEVNLGGTVLQSIKDLPFLSAALYDSVPEEEQEEVEKDSTTIKSMVATFSIANEKVRTENLILVSNVFVLDADGIVDFDSNFNMNVTMVFNADFCEGLAAKTKEIKEILDEEGRLVIPLKITGRLPDLKVQPNTKKLVKMGTKRLLKSKAGEVLGDFLGGKGDSKTKGLGGLFGY